MSMHRSAAILLLCLAGAAPAPPAGAQSYDPALLREMRWRMIGPHRGGRTKAAAGIPDQPGVFYVGVCNGGVWKTDDYGRTWSPIFDDQPTGSIGAIAIAPNDPNVIYVGSGEGLQRPDLSTGDGIYKSVDGGRSWRHLGLREGRQIPQIVVDPQDPSRLFVAVPGPYTVRLTVNGRTLSQPLVVKMDPRVKTPPDALRAQLDRSMEVARDMARVQAALRPAGAPAARGALLAEIHDRLTTLYEILQEADAAPTPAALETAERLRQQVTQVLASAPRDPP